MDPIESIAQAIATFEGFFRPGSRAQRNNNPGNLRYVGQPDAIGADGAGYAIFPAVEAGWEALRRQIRLDASRGLTLEQFIGKYAPPSENPTGAYLSFVSQKTGIRPSDPLPFALAPLGQKPSGADFWCEGDELCWWFYGVPRQPDYTAWIVAGAGLLAVVTLLS